jgi:hypothetical protein
MRAWASFQKTGTTSKKEFQKIPMLRMAGYGRHTLSRSALQHARSAGGKFIPTTLF